MPWSGLINCVVSRSDLLSFCICSIYVNKVLVWNMAFLLRESNTANRLFSFECLRNSVHKIVYITWLTTYSIFYSRLALQPNMSLNAKLGTEKFCREEISFASLAKEYERILSRNEYRSVGWILQHSKVQKCLCLENNGGECKASKSKNDNTRN